MATRVGDEAIALINRLNSAEIARTDLLISEQEKRLAASKENAEKGNAQTVELEQKRLDALIRQREAFVERQRTLNAVLAISNFAAATAESIKGIAAAASQGGVLAPITIALYLASIGAGIASILSLLSQAESSVQGFYQGVIDLDGNNGTKQKRDKRDTIPAFLSKGESVMTVAATKKYRSELVQMNEGTFKPINNVLMYHNIGNRFSSKPQAIAALNGGGVDIASRLERIETLILKELKSIGGDVILDGQKVGQSLQKREQQKVRVSKLIK